MVEFRFQVLFLSAVIISVSNYMSIANGQLDTYDYGEGDYVYDEGEYPDYDPCFLYKDESHGQCHHNNFPNKTVQDILGNNVKSCCDQHGYTFFDQCEAHSQSFEKTACGKPGQNQPELMSARQSCPGHCTWGFSNHFNTSHVIVDPTSGNLTFKNTNEALVNATVPNYCAVYQCKDSGWAIGFEVCLCPDPNHIKKVDSKYNDSELTRCCPKTLLTLNPTSASQNMTCPLQVASDPEPGLFCPHSYFETYDEFDVSNADGIVVETYDGKKTTLKKDSQDYCVGPSWPIQKSSLDEPIKMHLFRCKAPCDGKKPCIRTCDEDPKLSLDNWINSSLSNFLQESMFETHLTKAGAIERQCSKSDKYHRRVLNPKSRCRDQIELTKDTSEIKLRLIHNDEFFNGDQYCLILDPDENVLKAEVCVEIKEHGSKFKFYPYIQMVSCFFLLLTLIVYSVVPNLLNFYSRLMRHYVVTLFMAFSILATIQLDNIYSTPLKTAAPGLCQFLGFVVQYFFLASFSLMTAMSCECWLQVKDKRDSSNLKRYRAQLGLCYGGPLIITLMTLIVEFGAARCSAIRPKFAEESCFFAGNESKGVWFFLPIGSLLIVNAIMFSLTIKEVFLLDWEAKRLNYIEEKTSSQRTRVFLFMKLFLGMGLLWFFEIIGGLLNEHVHESAWYVFDVLNMLQGLYIFAIFVVKRSVIEAILKMIRQNRGGEEHSEDIGDFSMNTIT